MKHREYDETVTLSALQDLLDNQERIAQEALLLTYAQGASDDEWGKLMTLIIWARDPNLIQIKG